MAWLHAVPKPDERTRRAANAAEAPRISRLEKMRARKITPVMPPNPAPLIVNRLIEIGLTEAAGMGMVTLSWSEIDAWCNRTGIALDPWQARLIRRLSAAYIVEGRRAEAETCPPPWHAPVTTREIETEEAALRSVLG